MSELESVPDYVKVNYFDGGYWHITLADQLLQTTSKVTAQTIIDLLVERDELKAKADRLALYENETMTAVCDSPNEDSNVAWRCCEDTSKEGWHWLDGDIELAAETFPKGTTVRIFEPRSDEHA